MQPDTSKITIRNNEERILEILHDIVFNPRIKALQWSAITKQTPSLKIGYPSQHLASLIMGMEGERTAARGNDICDGTEIKACNRVDQLDKCKVKTCKENVMRIETFCPSCGSTNIKRAKDSKWLFGIKSTEELRVYTVQTNRIFLLLFDYPNFDDNDFNTIRIQAYEIWNNSPRCTKFKELLEAYYNDIYCSKHAS
ncbi:MAG: MamI family restriction endonuclease [Campylobacterota bacterium]|nr:MamI family restriction endonuclease [Campylobacterota bacterium]